MSDYAYLQFQKDIVKELRAIRKIFESNNELLKCLARAELNKPGSSCFSNSNESDSAIIAVDFDGTLCENNWPNIGKPQENVIKYVKTRKANGAKLILWTNRRDDKLEEAIRWCAEHGIEFDAVNDNLPEIIESFGGNCRKIFANEYLDDRAVLPQSII